MSPDPLDRTLYHRKLLVRILSLAGLGVALHLLAWSLGYYLLPPEALRDVFLSSRAPVVGGSEESTLARVLVVNLLLGVGLLNGTGSFAVSRAPRAPSLWGLLRSRGCWEIMAYTIVAAATVGLFVYRQRSWLNWSTRKENSFADLRISGPEWAAIALALALLVAANWTEARSLMGG